jgi:hypothetical protein
MDELLTDLSGEAVLARLESAVDEVIGLSLTSSSDDEVVALWQRLEAVSRRLAVADHVVIGEVSSRRLDFGHGCTGIAGFARQALRIGIREAHARVRGADAAGPRRAMTGQALGPIYPRVAAAQAAGDISPAHARIIVGCVDKLPDAVQAERGHGVEQFLVEQAGILDPDALAKLGERISLTLDPDGHLNDVAYRERHRDFRARQRPDGSGTIGGEFTAEAMQHLLTMLDTLARPRPETEGLKDSRTPGQRRHDAVLEALKMVERCAQLPDSGAITTSLILTATRQDWENNEGSATTGHGAVIPVREAKKWLDGESRVIAAVFDRARSIWGYSSIHRFFTQSQRLAMAARDNGCTFPRCDAPVQQCQSHHITDYGDGGPTAVDNGCLLCAFHHREFTRMGWTGVMIHGTPHWIPPPWIDPDQTPRRNTIHDPAPDLVGV